MRRPWFIALVSFAVVLAFGGLAAAVPAVFNQSSDNKPDSSLDGGYDAVAGHEAFIATLASAGAFWHPVEEAEEPAHEPEEPAHEPEEPAVEEPDEPAHEPEEPAVEEPDEPAHEPEVPIEPEEPEDTTPPDLVITHPGDGAHFNHDRIEFAGHTEPGAHVFAGPWEADVDDEGNWWIVLFLEPGANGASFYAEDAAGNVSDASITVYYEPIDEPGGGEAVEPGGGDGVEPGGGDEWPAGEWEANQAFGSCEENPPYDVFYGWTAPLAAVSVTSPYGSGGTTAGENGGWELKVFFPEAPHGETFTVTVSSAGHSKAFSFTAFREHDGGVGESGGHEGEV